MRIVIATLKSWNEENARLFVDEFKDIHDIRLILNRESLSTDLINEFNPDWVFFPHWSYIIPKNIYERYNCVVFHMTDLPFGRGGSPLQNLISRGYKETKISAIKVVSEIDAGPIYLKIPLGLSGTAEDIFKAASNIIFNDMIPYIINNNPTPIEQYGEVVVFKRRNPKDSQLNSNMTMKQIYDYIRMLDAEGYPKAYIDFGSFQLEFNSAKLTDKQLEAKVVFRRK